jgi:hypothetical protein
MKRPGGVSLFFSFLNGKSLMKKTDAALQTKRAERQVAHTSGGGHLGGTLHGQGNDAKTTGGGGKSSRSTKK